MSGPLIGRTAELAALSEALERAADGQAATVLVAGEAGVGKSRLVGEFAGGVRAGGGMVLVGHCVGLGEGELPYAPVAGALRALASRLEPADLDEVLGPGRGELARLVPALGAAHPAGAFGKARLFELVLGALGRLGARGPVLLVIEDLHWADGSTRDLLRFLVRTATTERLALVVTHRTDVDRGHPVRPYVAELARDPRVSRVAVPPFSRAELADHVQALRGALPGPSALDRLFERSEGNPFFAEELLAGADADGLPPSVRDALLLRLESLSPQTQAVLRVLAVAGRRVEHPLVAAVTRLPSPDLDAALREAAAGQVLVARGDLYEFRHALLREVAYAEVLPGERRALHAELADVLEARPELAGAGAALAAELAHHRHAAGDPARALAASVEAGEAAARLPAHPEALRHFQRALELWDDVRPAEGDRLAVTEAAADAANAAGEHALAVALARRAAALAGPEAAARAHARVARCLWEAGDGPAAVAASARAVELASPARTADRARVLESHARQLLLTGRAAEATAPIEEAIAIARERGDAAAEADALATRIIALHGRAAAAAAAGEEAMAVARRAGAAEPLMRAYVNASEALDHAGRVQAAIDLAREGLEAARRLGAERLMGSYLKGEIAARLLKLGRFDEAAATAQDALRDAPSGVSAVVVHHAAAVLAAHRGDAARAEEAAAAARASALEGGSGQSSAGGAAALAEAALWRGDPDAAWAIVEAALAAVEASEYVWYSAPLYALGAWALADRALRARAERGPQEAAARRGAGDRQDAQARERETRLARGGADDRQDAAAREGETLLALGGTGDPRDAAARQGEALLARLDERLTDDPPPEVLAHRAQAAAEVGRLADPPDAGAWAAAGRRWAQLGFPFHRAFCAWREAEALVAGGGDRRRAAEALASATAAARELGALPLAEEAAALARRARLAPALPGAPAGLSPRELEVLGLVAEGRTNREIGSELFISEKTVSVHVSRILAKLDVTNRAQAATVAHRLGVRAGRPA